MKHKNTRRGFTLIELLVVVLIIGILAAVALPQYKVAVVKSRIAAILPIVDTLRKASIVYYMAHGKYTTSISELDVDIPCTESVRMEDNMPFWKCGNDFLVQVDVKSIYANYCPNHNSSYETCKEVRDIQLGFPYKEGAERYCLVLNNSSLGERVCKALGKDIGSGKSIIP